MDNLLRQRSLAASTGKVEYKSVCVCVYTCNDVREERQEGEREGGSGRGSEGEKGRGGEGGGEREREDVQCTFSMHFSLVFILHCRPSAQTENKTTQY